MATRIADISTFTLPAPQQSDEGKSLIQLAAVEATLLEAALPFRELSLVAKADRRAVDPVYGTHRWWARRPPGVIRALLLASALPASTPKPEFWAKFAAAERHLEGLRVHDMFAGGGAMLVEAARLGGIPSGTDVDPLAVDIVRHELNPPSTDLVELAAEELLESVTKDVAHLFAGSVKGWTPLHYFYLHEVCCLGCGTTDALYRNLVIARDLGKSGGVLRDASLVIFCPECFRIHQLANRDRRELRCCGRRFKLDQGTFRQGKFICRYCNEFATHRQLRTGIAPRRLLAIEETSDGSRRRLRGPKRADIEQINASTEYLTANKDALRLPNYEFTTERLDGRPVSFGITKVVDLFTDRQLVVFGTAFAYLDTKTSQPSIERALRLAVSNALTTNNKLCSYATDYGRLAPLFSVRSYSLPWLAVELNPFHPSAGRGTLAKAFKKMLRSTEPDVRRYSWSTEKKKALAQDNSFPRLREEADVRCASAADPLMGITSVDICLFDPPYFDYIAYSELSEFYRAWRNENTLGGEALLPKGPDPSRSFGEQLGKCLEQILRVLKQHRPLTFTFHSLSKDAWQAIGTAVDAAKLNVTALWPVLNDAHMGHHGAKGNCEWDLVVVCRRSIECIPAACPSSISAWSEEVKPLRIGKADRLGMSMALKQLAVRFGKPRTLRSSHE